MWLLVPWANFQGKYVASSEFCGGVDVSEKRGQRTLQAAADRVGGRRDATEKQTSELLKTWSRLTTTFSLRTQADISLTKYAFFFFLLHKTLYGWSNEDLSCSGQCYRQSNATKQCHFVNNEIFHSSKYILSKWGVFCVCVFVCVCVMHQMHFDFFHNKKRTTQVMGWLLK